MYELVVVVVVFFFFFSLEDVSISWNCYIYTQGTNMEKTKQKTKNNKQIVDSNDLLIYNVHVS